MVRHPTLADKWLKSVLMTSGFGEVNLTYLGRSYAVLGIPRFMNCKDNFNLDGAWWDSSNVPSVHFVPRGQGYCGE